MFEPLEVLKPYNEILTKTCSWDPQSNLYSRHFSLFKINMQLNSEEEKRISSEQYLDNLSVAIRPVILKVSLMKVL